MEPLRAGIVGLGRAGLYHLECLSTRGDWAVAVVCDADPTRQAIAADFGCRSVSEFESLLDTSHLDVVWIASPPETHARLAGQALRAGLHVILERPLAFRSDECDALLQTAAQSQRLLAVSRAGQSDLDFRLAQPLVKSGVLGRLRSVDLILREYAVVPDTEVSLGDILNRFGWLYFEQLLELVCNIPQSVFATSIRDGEERETGFLAVVTFPNGTFARIEVATRGLVPFRTGWLLEGTAGSYGHQRRYSITAAGEIIDEPLEPPADVDFYTEMAQQIRSGILDREPLRAAAGAVRLMELVRASAAQRRPVDW